ncbi:MAG: NifB/NifX family molybdenum-iron cluster-binding protein [Sedimentisphaerales bacterium]|nr:NifB/NifX family molybdenum-iron cluster-binding protein [Sedimentisphaerales bacterium]
MTKVAIALFGTRVSPRFDCAPTFQIVQTDGRTVTATEEVSAQAWSAVERVNQLRTRQVNTLICGGIDMFSAQQLNHYGIKTYSWITGEARDALDGLLQGKLQPGFLMAPGGRCCGRWRFRGGHGRGRQKGWCTPPEP